MAIVRVSLIVITGFGIMITCFGIVITRVTERVPGSRFLVVVFLGESSSWVEVFLCPKEIGAKRRLFSWSYVVSCLRREGPFSTRRWALWRRRSQMASARVGSSM